VEIKDTFKGSDTLLCDCIEALIEAELHGSLVPHGIGGHGLKLLSACYCRLKKRKTKKETNVKRKIT
jgi:hypothetical protein